MLRNTSFAPEFCSLISNWFDMRKQAPGANLLHESVAGASSLVCTEICLPWHDVSPVGQSNWLIFFIHNSLRTHFQNGGRGTTSSYAPIGLFHHSAASSCPSCVLVGVLTRERVSGASSLVCTGLYRLSFRSFPRPPSLVFFLRSLPTFHSPSLSESLEQANL